MDERLRLGCVRIVGDDYIRFGAFDSPPFQAGRGIVALRRILGRDWLVETSIKPFDHPADSPFRADGPDLAVGSSAALAFSMAFHELCTNAAKYGALSTDGIVAIKWRIEGADTEGSLEITWTERAARFASSHRATGSERLWSKECLPTSFVASPAPNTSRRAWYSGSSYRRPIFVRRQSNRTRTG